MGKTISNIIATVFLGFRWLLECLGWLMDMMGFPEAAAKISNFLETPDGSFNYIAAGFWVGVIVLLALNWRSIANLFGEKEEKEPNAPKRNTHLKEVKYFYNQGCDIFRKLQESGIGFVDTCTNTIVLQSDTIIGTQYFDWSLSVAVFLDEKLPSYSTRFDSYKNIGKINKDKIVEQLKVLDEIIQENKN